MRLHEIGPAPGSKKRRTRVGRGIAAGKGKTAGRGTKGQNSRSGGGVRPYFEGGQLPLVRRFPQMRGFRNPHRREFAVVNVERLASRFRAGDEVTPEVLAEAGMVKKSHLPIKILGRGDLESALQVKAHAFSAQAKAKIEAAGGSAQVIKEQG
ncbi:MAG: 50S ribosomal protein L15 [Anaerolineae bacterium]